MYERITRGGSRWACAVIVTVGVLSSGSVHADGPPPDSHPPARVWSDVHGALRQVVLHYTAEYAADLETLYSELLAALPTDVRVHAICASQELAAQFEERWGDAERSRGRDLVVTNVDRPITIWARDRHIARQRGTTDSPAPSVIPAESPSYGEQYRNDLLIAPLLELAGSGSPTVDTFIHVEGGNIVANDRHAFVGADVIAENKARRHDPAAVRRELLQILGRPLVLVGDQAGRTPWRHVDMYVTPIDEQTVLVASPALALVLLGGESEACLVLEESGLIHDWPGSLTHGQETLDAVAAQLREYGYRVVRLPTVVHCAESWMITYNNVLLEQRAGRRIVYMPVYNVPELDEAAESIYRSLGCEVRCIDVSGVFADGGALRCLVNVTERSTDSAGASEVAAAGATAQIVAGRSPGPDPAPEAGSPPARRFTLAGLPERLGLAVSWLPLLIFCARITDVSLGTVRLICVTRGQRAVAVVLAFAEISVWLLSVATVLTNLSNWLNLLAYAGGYTAGNAMGMWIEGRLALGAATVLLISRQKGPQIAARLRQSDFRATTLTGAGRDGAVELCLVLVRRRDIPLIISAARAVDPDVITTVEDVRHTSVRPFGGPLLSRLAAGMGRPRFPWWPRRQTGRAA